MTSWRRPPTFMPGDALVPAGDDLADAEAERERLAAVVRRVELLAGRVRDADVVDAARCSPAVASAPSPTTRSVTSQVARWRRVGKVDLGFLGHRATLTTAGTWHGARSADDQAPPTQDTTSSPVR